MAKAIWICLVVILALASVSNALKCLKCSDCKNEPSTSQTCPPLFNVCMKLHLDKKIRKGCGLRPACKMDNIERGSFNPFRDLKNLFGDQDVKKLISDKRHAHDKIIHCCETDFCNGTPEKKASLGLLLALPMAVYYLGW